MVVARLRTYAGYDCLTAEQIEGIESVSMDMWQACIDATLGKVPDPGEKIAFDRFHVAKALGDAVDRVCRQEHGSFLQQGDTRLTGTGYAWQTGSGKINGRQRRSFRALRDSSLQTARAWATRECAAGLWDHVSRTWATKAWKRWYGWAIRSRLEPVGRVARMVMKRLWGIVNAIILKADNGHADSVNGRIWMLKIRSRGYRCRERFKTAIHFHLGGLDLHPKGIR